MKKLGVLFSISFLLTVSVMGQIYNPALLKHGIVFCENIKNDLIRENFKNEFNLHDLNFASSAKAADGIKTVKRESNMRESASFSSNLIYKIPAGSTVRVLSSTSNYDKIEYRGKTGYILGGSLTSKPTTPSSSKNNCDNITIYRASPKPSFQDMTAGVRYATIINSPEMKGHVAAFNALYKYLEAMGFSVRYLSDNYISTNKIGEEIWVSIEFDYNVIEFSNIKLIFYNQGTGYIWMFSTRQIAKSGMYDDAEGNFYSALRGMNSKMKNTFNRNKTIDLPKKLTCWKEHTIKQDFQTNGLDQIEGIYENTASQNSGEAKYRVAVKKINSKFHLIYLSGAINFGDWEEGEIKATLESTATPNFYKAKWIMANKSENDDFYVTFQQGLMSVVDDSNQNNPYIKLYPTTNDNVTSFSNTPASGTGFAISSNGLIVTNNHVIEGAKTIKVRGVNGDFSRAYSAKLIIADKNNDLAIIKIDDYSFTKLETIPYVIKNTGNVGENIFVLGYPLRTTMGDEIKLTNGIISSRTGYQGDVTSYQISAPIQPGNSGGPLFDSQGNLIGIINAKHGGAENASYAVKSSYLTNLIDLLDSFPTLQSRSTLSGKPLSQQVSIVKNFVYTIEVN